MLNRWQVRRFESRGQHTRGVGLVETLIALLVVAVGVVGFLKFQSSARLNSDVARQRTEALRLAQNDIEQLRSSRAADIQSSQRKVTPEAANTSFDIGRAITAGNGGSKTAQVTVSWLDRNGVAQQVLMTSILATQPTELTGALAVAQRTQDALPLNGRSSAIPPQANDLGDSRSVFKLSGDDTTAYLWDNRSGRVTASCTGVQRHARHIVVGDLSSCTTMAAVLISGQVRFSMALPPDAARPADAPLALSMELALSGGPYAHPAKCGAEAMKTISYLEGGKQRRAAVPEAATAITWAASNWVELGERFTAYHCVVVGSGTPAKWSGRLKLVPQGWTLGRTATDFKTCRYSAQTPDAYVDVSTSLTEQNFLVIRGDQACPSASALKTNGEGVQNFTDLSTVELER